MMKKYVKDESFDPIYTPVNQRFLLKSRLLPTSIFALALFLFVYQVAVPLLVFKTTDEVSKPMGGSVLGMAAGFSEFEFEELEGGRYRQAGDDYQKMTPQFFFLSVPKLGIKEAMVETNSPTFSPDQSLGHYAGSALPGMVGNTFIYGHSVLPWFFNAKNYKTIFSTLSTLEKGDTFSIKYNDKAFNYKVEKVASLKPDEVDPLAEFRPKYLNASTVTLMTCDPPGTRLKRLLVQGVRVVD